MKAVVWRGDRTLEIETVEDARLEAPTDVLLRLTSTAICGTDLHISHRLPLSQAPEAFQKFDQRIDGYIKVILDLQR